MPRLVTVVLRVEFIARAPASSDMTVVRLMVSLLIFTDRAETDSWLTTMSVTRLAMASIISFWEAITDVLVLV